MKAFFLIPPQPGAGAAHPRQHFAAATRRSAAIQGLNEKVESQIAELKTENAELKQQLAELKVLVRQRAQREQK